MHYDCSHVKQLKLRGEQKRISFFKIVILASCLVTSLSFIPLSSARESAEIYPPISNNDSILNLQHNRGIIEPDIKLVQAATDGLEVILEPILSNYPQEIKVLLNTEARAIGTFSQSLNQAGILPNNFKIVFAKCGKMNAFYTPEHKAIVMCYELMQAFAIISAENAPNQEEWMHSSMGMTLFAFLHELGHGLIDVLNLPITGSEEDSVDRFAAVLAAELGNSPEAGDLGEHMIFSTAIWYRYLAQNRGEQKIPYWDEHPLDQQRYYTIICLLYGSKPAKYASMAQFAGLPSSRAKRCPAEFEQAKKGWQRLLTGALNQQ